MTPELADKVFDKNWAYCQLCEMKGRHPFYIPKHGMICVDCYIDKGFWDQKKAGWLTPRMGMDD